MQIFFVYCEFVLSNTLYSNYFQRFSNLLSISDACFRDPTSRVPKRCEEGLKLCKDASGEAEISSSLNNLAFLPSIFPFPHLIASQPIPVVHRHFPSSSHNNRPPNKPTHLPQETQPHHLSLRARARLQPLISQTSHNHSSKVTS